MGRELLAAIATVHPYIVSVLLEILRETIHTVGMVSVVISLRLYMHVVDHVKRKISASFGIQLLCECFCMCLCVRWLSTYAKNFL